MQHACNTWKFSRSFEVIKITRRVSFFFFFVKSWSGEENGRIKTGKNTFRREERNFPPADGDNDKIRDSNPFGLGVVIVPFRWLLAAIHDEIGLHGERGRWTSHWSILPDSRIGENVEFVAFLWSYDRKRIAFPSHPLRKQTRIFRRSIRRSLEYICIVEDD